MANASPTETEWLKRLFQVSDSAFPTGGYAHSYGLEEVVRLGIVRDAATLESHLRRHLWPMLIHFELPVVRLAQQATLGHDLESLLELDALVEAGKTPRELREASRATGKRRLHALRDAGAVPALLDFEQAIKEGRAQGHHAVVYGLGLASVPTAALLTSWAYQSLSAACFAAPKLLRIGQEAAQRVLTSALDPMEQNVADSMRIEKDEIGWFDPLLDMASMRHEIAYERLFIS